MLNNQGAHGGFSSFFYNIPAAVGNCFLVCCSYVFRILSGIFGRPAAFVSARLRSSVHRFACAVKNALHDENGNKKYFTGRMSRSVKRVMSFLPRHPLMALRAFYGYADKGSRIYAPVIRGLLCIFIPFTALLAVVFTTDSILSLNTSLEVKSGGETIGYVADEQTFLQARALALSRVSLADGSLPDVTYCVSVVSSGNLTDSQTLARTLIEKSDVDTITACGVYIDGEFLCAVGCESQARRIFTEKAASVEAENENDIIGFVEEITYETGLFPNTPEVLWSEDKLARTVETDSTLLTVKTVRTVVETHTVGYSTVYVETDSLLMGSERVVVAGEDGVDQITSFVTYVGGEQVSRKDVARLTVIAPVTQRVQTGTRQGGEDEDYGYYGGVLIWPTIGATNINSSYGYRWGKLHAGLDLGCSYGTSYGKSVVAAADGTVIISSYNSMSGYYVKIDHGNGLQTLYAHMQSGSVRVNVGDRVYAGEQIGNIGATGYVTGPHLHFEVWKYGSRVDPGTYLGLY